MGKKRKRASKSGNEASTPRHGGTWPAPVVDELLAYLDSGVAFLDPETKAEIDRKYEDVDEEISQHLNAVNEENNYSSEPLRRFSAAQVRNKLHRMWVTHGREEFNDRDWKVIYRRGSSCLLSSKDPEQADRVARRSGVIKVKWVESYLRSPRKTRAGSQLSRGSHLPPWTSGSPSSSSPVESDADSIRSQRSITRHIKVEKAGIEIVIPGVSDSNFERTVSREHSQQSMSPEPEVYGTPSAGLASFNDHDDSGDVSVRATTIPWDLNERLSTLENELNVHKMESALEIDFWKARCRTIDDDNAKLEREKNDLVVKIGALTETGGQLTVNDFLESQAKIDNLVKVIHSQRNFQGLKRRMGENSQRRSIPGISKLMQTISTNLQGTIMEGNFVPLQTVPELPQGHPLRALVQQAFAFDWDSSDAAKLLEHSHRCCDMQRCSVTALAGVALAQWVFKRNQADLVFDRYQDSSSRCSTNRYRDALDLVALEDPDFARAIDLKVHTKIVEEASFEHFRKRKAQALALKLQQVLAPLWNGDAEEDDGLDSGTDDDPDVTEQLTEVFDKALDVQCQLVLTGQQYECIWYAPGDAFDETNMTPYKIEGGVGTDVSTIRLTLLPGINQVVDSKVGADFGGFGDGQRWPQGDSVCLVPPLVWRGCAELH